MKISNTQEFSNFLTIFFCKNWIFWMSIFLHFCISLLPGKISEPAAPHFFCVWMSVFHWIQLFIYRVNTKSVVPWRTSPIFLWHTLYLVKLIFYEFCSVISVHCLPLRDVIEMSIFVICPSMLSPKSRALFECNLSAQFPEWELSYLQLQIFPNLSSQRKKIAGQFEIDITSHFLGNTGLTSAGCAWRTL